MSSTRTQVTLLRPWIRRFTIIISAWWLQTSSKFTWEEVKTSTEKLGKWSTPKRVRIRPKYSAPSLSRDRRIKMHQSINQFKKQCCPRAEDRAIFEDLRPQGQDQGLDLRGQGLQNVSLRPRTSSRTPPLLVRLERIGVTSPLLVLALRKNPTQFNQLDVPVSRLNLGLCQTVVFATLM